MCLDCDGIEAARLIEMVSNACDKQMADSPGALAGEQQLLRALESAIVYMKQLAEQMDLGTFDRPLPELMVDATGNDKAAPTVALPPLLERAHVRKQDAIDAEGLKWQVEKRENEILELKRSLRTTAEEISEMKV
jgi:hypothetical protein